MAALKQLYESTLAERLQNIKDARAEAAAAAARADAAEADLAQLRAELEGVSAPLAQVICTRTVLTSSAGLHNHPQMPWRQSWPSCTPSSRACRRRWHRWGTNFACSWMPPSDILSSCSICSVAPLLCCHS